MQGSLGNRALATMLLTFAILISLALLVPAMGHAQTSANLEATIRAELMSDPRTASLTSAQVEAMVSLLAQEAQRQGITASDITSRPSSFAEEMTDVCEGTPKVSCVFDVAFGLIGPDSTIPYILGATSMGLIWLLAEMIHRRRYPAAPQPAPVNTSAI